MPGVSNDACVRAGIISLLAVLSACSESPDPPEAGDDGETIVFFYDAHCPDCAVVKDLLLEPFAARMGLSREQVTLKDIARPEVAGKILELERRLGFEAESLAPILVFRGKAWCGLEEIRRAAGNG